MKHYIIIFCFITFMILWMGGIIYFFVLQIKKDIIYEKATQALGDELVKVSTKEEWLVLKIQIVQHIKDGYRPKYAEKYTTHTLYGILADKAEKIFNNDGTKA